MPNKQENVSQSFCTHALQDKKIELIHKEWEDIIFMSLSSADTEDFIMAYLCS